MNDQENILPEKCCAKCGFLYAVNSIASHASDEIYDPDLLRLNKGKRYQGDLRAEELTLKPYQMIGSGFRRVRWDNTETICCLQNKFERIQIHTRKAQPDLSAVEIAYTAVFQDRSNCSDFFSYHPGFSAKEHAEIRLQQKREQEQQEFQERQNKLFLQLETTAAERDLFWKQKIEKVDQKEDRDRSLDRWITIIFAILATIISFINLLNTFRNPNP